MLKSKLLAIISTVLAVAACAPEKVSFDTLESARTKAKENATWNAVQYRASSPFVSYSIDSTTDSTMTASCPQGDGWASVKLINPDDPTEKIGLKCSTVSNAVGCMTDNDFKSKDYANDDGYCQSLSKVPFPLPTLKK